MTEGEGNYLKGFQGEGAKTLESIRKSLTGPQSSQKIPKTTYFEIQRWTSALLPPPEDAHGRHTFSKFNYYLFPDSPFQLEREAAVPLPDCRVHHDS